MYNILCFSVYTHRDCYIGLYRYAAACSCQGFTDSVCEACRASWSWYDGTEMSWWNWQDEEPNQFACGRLSSDAWAENDCDDRIRYICQKGTSKLVCLISSAYLLVLQCY